MVIGSCLGEALIQTTSAVAQATGANAPSISNGDRGLRICLGPVLREEDLNDTLASDSNDDIDKFLKELSPFPLQRILSGSL